jgi:hypothetical protein
MDAAKEAEVERRRFADRSSGAPPAVMKGELLPIGMGRSMLRLSGEDVFLAQLHRRSVLLNEGFQHQILQILGRHETVTHSENKAPNSITYRESTTSEGSWRNSDVAVVHYECKFADGIGKVEVHQAPVKTWVDPRNLCFACHDVLFTSSHLSHPAPTGSIAARS